MAVECRTVPAVDGFAAGMISFLDCEAQTLAARGYAALAAPGSSASLLLTAMLAIFVALFGYRMLFGETPTVRDGVLALVKIGVVLAFATSWPAYQIVVYDVVLRAPADLAAEIGGPAGVPGSAGGLPARLDGVDQAFRTLAIYGVGNPVYDLTGQTPSPQAAAPPLFAGFDTFALGASRVAFLIGALGGFAIVRLAAGLLLALGPLFLAFLLFDGTRGLFEGWARALIGAALGALATAILLGVELSLLEPWLAELVVRRAAGTAILGVPAALFSATLVFNLVLAGLLAIVGRVAFSLRLPRPAVRLSNRVSEERMREGREPGMAVSNSTTVMPTASRSRAAAIADQVASAQRREEQVVMAGLPAAAASAGRFPGGGAAGASASVASPLGQSHRRRTATRVSASAGARDRAS